MRGCPICNETQADDRFRSRAFANRCMPVCVSCFDIWRTKQREMSEEVNRGVRKLESIPTAPWQLGMYDVKSKSKSWTRNERIEYMLNKAGIRLPVNPSYEH
jgi:hypothetical protein